MALATSTWIAIGSAVVGAAGSYSQREEAKAATKKAERDKRESNATARAEEQARLNESRRQQIREERIRRATIAQQSSNSGVSGSSGEIGSMGALATQTGANLGSMARQTISTDGISRFNQSAADNMSKASNAMGKAQLYDTVFSTAAPIALDGLMGLGTNSPTDTATVGSGTKKGKKNIFS